MLWFFASPILAALLFVLARGVEATPDYLWIGLFGMMTGYLVFLRLKWDFIQAVATYRHES